MNKNEFKRRTEAFLSASEIDRYEADFEPAYMAADGIDKDDFCAMLADKTVREFVREMSASFDGYVKNSRELQRRYADMTEQRDIAKRQSAGYRQSLSLISAACDRAFAAANSAI